MIRVLIVDDQPLIRAGLRGILELEEDLEVIGEAESGGQAVQQARDLPVDVVLMDIRMPGNRGHCRDLFKPSPGTPERARADHVRD